MKFVHVYRRDDGDYVLTTKWRKAVPGCSDVFSYLGVCRWQRGENAIDTQLMDAGSVVISGTRFRATVESLNPQLRLVRPPGDARHRATVSRGEGKTWLPKGSQQPTA